MNPFGPNLGPTKVPCLFCHYAMPHEHRDGYPPLLPCPACWVGWHEMCDGLTWFCVCPEPTCLGEP